MGRVKRAIIAGAYGTWCRCSWRSVLGACAIGAAASWLIGVGASIHCSRFVQQYRWLGGTGVPELISGESQPFITISTASGSRAMKWSRNMAQDCVFLWRPSEAEWEDGARDAFPTPDKLREKLARSGTPLREQPPYWANSPEADGPVAGVANVAFGWPLRVVLRQHELRLRADGTGYEDPVMADTYFAEAMDSAAWRPIWPALLGSALIVGIPLWMLILGAAWAVRRWAA